MNFSEIDKHVEDNLPALQDMQTNPETKLHHILVLVLPIIRFLSTAFFVPGKWREALKVFVAIAESQVDNG